MEIIKDVATSPCNAFTDRLGIYQFLFKPGSRLCDVQRHGHGINTLDGEEISELKLPRVNKLQYICRCCLVLWHTLGLYDKSVVDISNDLKT